MGVDFVITWVDGSDPEWQKEKGKYEDRGTGDIDIRPNRYRDWNSLHYWFRGVEFFAPWVRKIHFVTWGHVPAWLNLDHPKLNVVNHRDFIPEEYLPTFNSNTIELNFHRIDSLSDCFVYFNDDTFIIRTVEEADFFKGGLPRDVAGLNTVAPIDLFSHILFNNVSVINKHFEKRHVIARHLLKWFHPRYGARTLLKTLLLCPWPKFSGFADFHLPIAYKKTTLEEVWTAEFELLDKACRNKFRSKNDVSGWLFRYWRIVKGEFAPMSPEIGRNYSVDSNCNRELFNAILKQKHKLICINDDLHEGDFEKVRSDVNLCFERILPTKSSFER